MDQPEALALLKRLMSCKKDQNFLSLEYKNSIFSYSSMPEGRHSDTGILLTYLSSGETAMARAEMITHQMQKKSATSREQADRAFYAKSAMLYAIASGSMALYHEVINWSCRYLRDPVTVRVVFGSGSILTEEGVHLLSVMYDSEIHTPSTVSDHWQVAEGNKTLLELFGLACCSLGEPSFNVHDWDGVKSIYRLVIERRLLAVTFLQRGDHVSKEIIDDKVWRESIDALIEFERIACKLEHERLRFNSAAGPLSHGIPYSIVMDWTRLSSACYLFLDTLAKARDELWKDAAGTGKDANKQQPTVKVTTVKYLVQLLNETALVSPYKSLSILRSLFQKSTHRDIHYAIAESMMAMLAGTAAQDDFASTNQTLQALKAMIPVVGRLNESVDIQEKHWIAFGEGAKVPVIEHTDSMPPLFGLLLDYAVKTTLPENVRRTLVHDIVLPAYELSKTAYNHWVSVLLSRYGILDDLGLLISIPPRPVVLAAMLRRIPELMPEAYFMEWHNYVRSNLVASPELSAAIHRLAEKVNSESAASDLPQTPDTDPILHWTRFLDKRSDVFKAFSFSLASLLRRPRTEQSSYLSDNPISLLQKLILEQADILIENFDTLNRSWTNFLAPLQPIKDHINDEWFETWAKNCVPIPETIIV
ncbi:MAG: hypothetical protein Q9221_003298 [Calogaya cf. arnoldii]